MKLSIKEKFLQFCDQFVQRTLMMYQIPPALRIVKSVLMDEGAEISILFCRQSGKTEAVSIAIAFLAIFINLFWKVMPKFRQRFDDGLRIGIASPKGEQGELDLRRARTILPNKILQAFDFIVPPFAENNSRFEVHMPQQFGTRIAFIVEAFSASETSNIESRTLDLIVCEEAQDISERKVEAEIEPMGAARNATRVFVGTVGYTRDVFYKTCMRNKARFPQNHFEVSYEVPIRENFRNGAYGKYVKSIIAKRGEESDYFKMKFRNVWVLEKGHPFNEETFRKLLRKDLHWMSYCHELPEGVFLVAGLDVAKDIDETVLGIATADFSKIDYAKGILYPDVVLRHTQSWKSIDYDLQFQEINKYLKQYFPLLHHSGTIAIDATGDRGSMTERFETEGYNTIGIAFTAGAQSGKGLLCQQAMDQVNTGHYFIAAADETILGTEYYYNFAIPDGKEILPMDPLFKKLKDQYIGLEREYKGNRLDLHAESGEYDDFWDMTMLEIHAARNIEYVDFSDLHSTGQRNVTADLIKEVKRDDFHFEKEATMEMW